MIGGVQAARVDDDLARSTKLLVSGALAGGISRTLTAPADRLKMLLQVQDQAQHMTLMQGIRKMNAEGGVRAYFKGNGANTLKIAPETGLKLAFNDFFKHHYLSATQRPEDITPMARCVSGGLSGALAQGLLYPLDMIRTRLAVCTVRGNYKGIAQTARRILREEGPTAFYRGITPSMIGILPYSGVDIACFEILKVRLLDAYQPAPPPAWAILGAGMLSSSIAQFISYPLALVRTRLQAQGAGGAERKYAGMVDVFRKTLEREGITGLYKGLLPNLIKLAPAAGVSWFVFEESKRALGLDPRS